MRNNNISIKKAALLNAIAKYITVVMQLIYIGVLSRLLTPQEFGIVAVINVFIVFFQLFADMGLGTGIIQNRDLQNYEVDDIFSFSIYIGIMLMVLFIIFSFPISILYNDKIYITLGIELSLSLMLNAFNMIPNAVLLKNKRFLSIAIRTVVVNLLAFALTIFLALRGMGVYALAANAVITAVGLFIWNKLSTELKFKYNPNFSSIKKIFGYSMFQFGSQALNYFNRNLDNLLIGRFFSPAMLGQYNKAYTLTRYPVAYLPGVITPILHPILSEHEDDKKYIYNIYTKLLKVLSLLGCFGAVFCFHSAKEIILLAFGSQWELAIIPFKILSISLWMQIMTNTIAPIYQSIGNTKLMFKSTILTTFIIVNCIVIGVVIRDINIVSLTISIGYMLNFFTTFYFLIKFGLNESYINFLSMFWQDSTIFFILLVAGFIYPVNIESIFLSFILKFFYFLFIYIVMLRILRQDFIFFSFAKKSN